MIVTLFGYLIVDEFIRSLISTKVDSDFEITDIQAINNLIDDNFIKIY